MKVIRWVGLLTVLLGLTASVKADVTVLLEEPYSYDGIFAGTGHIAVYLNRVCADSPTVLRRCRPHETGVVISRYHRIGGYDWIAIPIEPYLYAVEKPQDIPLFANARLEAALRDNYRRQNLEQLVPDGPDGATPPGDWYELIGSAYDRTLYGFELESTQAQDDAFIEHYNAAPNHVEYQVVTRNCADFVRDILNFYYPNSVSRNFISDLSVSTPKHVARSFAHYSAHHAELHFAAFVIPQIPGSVPRSRPVHGLIEAVVRAKKYELPLLAFHPFVAGGVAAAYAVGGRFNPAKDAQILDIHGDLEEPISAEQRKAYRKGLDEITQGSAGQLSPEDLLPSEQKTAWHRFLTTAQVAWDSSGHPLLVGSYAGQPVSVGVTRANLLNSSAPAELTRYAIEVRLREELQKGRAPRASDAELREDWKLLKETAPDSTTGAAIAADAAGPSSDEDKKRRPQ